ncbi:BREX-1 system adenine-specific DNA-methyltransferase PglX, partial [Flavobacteriaceae bacterium]|nr:BREX-1 system adenine-specific DNA-methyltransferase PglX [Flavobacteriaceae bacterium]
YQEGFFKNLFINVLGYKLNPEVDFNLITEFKNTKGSKKADGAILKEEKALAVIELKGTNTADLSKVETQAFGYKNNQPGCNYVIISNFEKLRFYIDNAVDFEEFNLFNLTKERFDLLWICLSSQYLLNDIPKKIKTESITQEDGITKKLYKDYSVFRKELFESIQSENLDFDKLTLFKKTQKLLDRFLFIFFAEDRLLLPPNSIRSIVNQWTDLRDKYDAYIPLYDRFKKYFGYMNTGHKGDQHSIFAYNGGLFAPDEILDNIKINDDLLHKHTVNLSNYDFESEVSVNILGHIFEHSLNDIDEIQAEIKGVPSDQSKTKRKKDGVFYTPKYITKYIVDNTVGKLCEEKKTELDIQEAEYEIERKGRQKATLKKLTQKLEDYRKWLLQITICDPACGSGAFLNQVLEFLIKEHQNIDELQAKLFGDAIILSEVENSILENNLFGVDINEESVEIAKLSLWLRTAQKGRKLTSLNKNIKCGNSIIDDEKITGDKAFNWHKEFPEVFSKGGFDVIIGNPPYVDIKALNNDLVKVLFEKYETTENRINLYSIFIEKSYSILKKYGFLSFIIPNSILVSSSYTKIRKMLLDDMTTIIKLPDDVFEDATVETIIFEFRKKSSANEVNTILYKKDEKINFIDNLRKKIILKSNWKQNDNYNFNIYVSPEQFELLKKISEDSIDLGEIAEFTLGITPYDKYKGHSQELIKSRGFHSNTKDSDVYKPLISGGNIERYFVSDEVKEYIKYGDWLGAPRDERFFNSPRVLVRQIVSGKPPRIYSGYTDKTLYYTQIGFGIIPKPDTVCVKSLLALLNSKLINFYHKYSFLDLEKELFQKILIANCKKFPLSNKLLKEPKLFNQVIDKMIELKEQENLLMNSFIELLQSKLSINKSSKKLQNWNLLDFGFLLKELKKLKVQLSLEEEAEWMQYFKSQKLKAEALKTDIEKTETEIDKMVYELYGLTNKEIEIVENS